MCGIVGALGAHQEEAVRKMLATVRHRGPDGQGFHTACQTTLGHTRLAILDVAGSHQPMNLPEKDSQIVYNGEIYNYRKFQTALAVKPQRARSDTETLLRRAEATQDDWSWLREIEGMFAFAISQPSKLILARDPLGIKPLYVGRSGENFYFASEIKALLPVADTLQEFPPGYVFQSTVGLKPYYRLRARTPDISHTETARCGLLSRLVRSVRASLMADVPVGVFLSGGLDSSLIAALARKFVSTLPSFAVGTPGSEDLARAQQVANYLNLKHQERIFTVEEAIAALPEVIYHLESFDCALVRSAIPNYFLAKLASKQVKVALAGEGADELFAGYNYLKALEMPVLEKELRHITCALHNTNLQRCDRMSMAHGLEARVPFLDDLDLVEYAFRISAGLKIRGMGQTEKWILRRAARELLPPEIVWRGKAKFATGCGLSDQIARYASATISDAAFVREQEIAENVFLQSKEELLYFRLFRETFPPEKVLSLVGRSRSL